jgi:histidyl-tRNA synthetase
MIKAVAGTKDVLPEEVFKWRALENLVANEMRLRNYKEIRTPIFEETKLFVRGIGESTDIVGKEMYTFLDKGGDSLTLRPEMTASVARAYIEHSLHLKYNVFKVFYIGPMFRQERPQAGRLRQFHQFGAEALGCDLPELDAEQIIIAYNILKKLGLSKIKVKINSLGSKESRDVYKQKLRDYLSDKLNALSDDSKKRFHTNILRIFDSKDQRDIEIMNLAPKIIDFLDYESKEALDSVMQILSDNNVPFEVESKLVRGLDYYTRTTFEIISESVGAQSALCGGGRYNNLIEELGGKPTPGVGFAAGIERILLACQNEGLFQNEENGADIFIIKMNEKYSKFVFNLSEKLRANGYSVEMDYLNRSLKAQMREANKIKAKYAFLIGDEEYEKGIVKVKRMFDGMEKFVKISNIIEFKKIFEA